MTESPGQLESLQHLLAEIAAGEPSFYQGRLIAAGLDEGVETVAEFLAKMPFTTKSELVEDHAARPPYGDQPHLPAEGLLEVLPDERLSRPGDGLARYPGELGFATR